MDASCIMDTSWIHHGYTNGKNAVQGRTRSAMASFSLILLGIVIGYVVGLQRSLLFLNSAGLDAQSQAPADQAAAPTLVLYSYFAGDEASRSNLEFFITHAIRQSDGVTYVIIMNGYADLEEIHALGLPQLPRNARFVAHRNECYDWGTYAWALDSSVEAHHYTYFIFMNSSVRGPILPWYATGRQHWTALFTDKLTDTVKLVGPAISCEHYCLGYKEVNGERQSNCRHNPHVQSVAVATDQAGLSVLRAAESVLRCHGSRGEAVFYGEIGASLAIEQAGYNIDSFLTRYQGVDWRLPGNNNCNGGVSPIGKNTFDGLTIPSYEMVFPKVKGSLLESQAPSHVEADKVSRWIALPVSERNISANWVMAEGKQLHAADVLVQKAKGMDCFDWAFYKRKNPDMARYPQELMWVHFLARGALEFREHRWTCELDADAIIPKWPPA